MDDFTPLTTPDHWLGWLGDNPAEMVRGAIEHCLQGQVPSAQLEWVRLLGKAKFLTGGREVPPKSGKILVTRAALAVEFDLQVNSEEGDNQLHGIFSWMAMGLNGERHDRTFFDLDMEMERAEEMLKSRIYDWDVFGTPASESEETTLSEEANMPEPPAQEQSNTPPKPRGQAWQFWRKKQ